MGTRRYLSLKRLELECAYVGLGYPRTDASAGPPWRLPESFATLPADALPAHPLIEPALLSRLAGERSDGRPAALDALSQLISPESLGERWNGVPRIGHAEMPIPGNARIAVCLHLFYPDLWPTLRAALDAIPEPWDLYVSVPAFACTRSLARIAEEHPSVRFMPCANRGRDVLPFLNWLAMGVFDRYDAVCKLHSKRSPHMRHGAKWLAQMLESLLGEPQTVAGIIEWFRSTPDLGLVGPRAWLIGPGHRSHQGSNSRALATLMRHTSLSKTALDSPFFAGTMFWFRPAALAGLRDLGLRGRDFPLEMGQTDGTSAHALERLICPLMEQAGYMVSDI
jgi:rhamnosyltransferase